MRKVIFWLPLGLFLAVVVVAAVMLNAPADRTIRSRLVGEPLPDFTLPAALPGRPGVASADYRRGEARVVNIFASWCVPCIAEAPYLVHLAERGIPIDAIAIRDRPSDIADFLGRWGDPYRNIGLDRDSAVQMALGSSGVPETFVVDGNGIIRHQHVGVVTDRDIPSIVAAYEAAR